jgi:hypothetical protein
VYYAITLVIGDDSMGKHNVLSGVLVLVVMLMIMISTILVVSYVTGVINAAVAFASSDQIGKLQACGVTTPAELFKLRDDIPSLVLPAIYVGFPGIMVIISILMFIAGYYYSGEKEASPIKSRGNGK